MQVLDIHNFLSDSKNQVILDVRSPSEFKDGHMVGAHSFPLFTDEERHEVGKTYKQKSREKAIELGYEIVIPKISDFIEFAANFETDSFYVHCWRGGMRSNAVAQLLDEVGYKNFVLENGYKAYRNHVLASFSSPLKYVNIAGYTGSGKTELLKLLEAEGHQILDLEGLAVHMGSAFGNLSKKEQPTGEQFENILADKILNFDVSKPVFVEDENTNLGRVRINQDLFNEMRKAPMIFIERSREQRISHILETYQNPNIESITVSFNNIKKRLGGQNLNDALDAITNNDGEKAVSIALSYYDRYYYKSLNTRPFKRFAKIDGRMPNTNVIQEIIKKTKLYYDQI